MTALIQRTAESQSIKDRMACFSWNPVKRRYEVVIGLYSKEIVATFSALAKTRAYVEAHNAKL